MPVADTPHIPKHIAIIMDGNGRWANRRGLPRTAGHKQGAEAARRVVKDAAEMGVEFVTLFGFSSENWSRPESEIKELMSLLRYYLRSETAELHKSGARLRVIGNRAELDDDIIQLIENAEDLTKDNDKITLVIALNYGGRHDILQAAQRLAEKAVSEGRVPDMKVIEKEFPGFLMTAGVPEPDLLIRTSGEQRISNFLLWQCAYSELVFTDTLWPDFDREDLEQAVQDFARRERRFGAIKQTGA
ncbi:MAG TPA: isoprenyl transferase [Alphaproteobacteria bacterium]|nr:isoprenyl transferase [Micavibrio sp.]MBK9563293.1 isoprenyl transferase [Micavibrio sp.]HQX27625.1 isoprenyl transferase [Alphaproteobacteria bacterium]